MVRILTDETDMEGFQESWKSGKDTLSHQKVAQLWKTFFDFHRHTRTYVVPTSCASTDIVGVDDAIKRGNRGHLTIYVATPTWMTCDVFVEGFALFDDEDPNPFLRETTPIKGAKIGDNSLSKSETSSKMCFLGCLPTLRCVAPSCVNLQG